MPRTVHRHTRIRHSGPPIDHGVIEAEDSNYRLEYVSKDRHCYRFSRPSDEDALRHVADYLRISYPLTELELARMGARALYRVGIASPIFPVQSETH